MIRYGITHKDKGMFYGMIYQVPVFSEDVKKNKNLRMEKIYTFEDLMSTQNFLSDMFGERESEYFIFTVNVKNGSYADNLDLLNANMKNEADELFMQIDPITATTLH